MSADHKKFCYSALCSTTDAAVLFCLRALCQFAETSPHPQIGWGGTKRSDWDRNEGRVKFRFTSSENRRKFVEAGERLLGGRWTLVSMDDADPATPQR